jgi:L-fucose mutarotase/ribose pyranase (RbsD/FucU family)
MTWLRAWWNAFLEREAKAQKFINDVEVDRAGNIRLKKGVMGQRVAEYLKLRKPT